jgi:hypothetical protein
MYSQHSAYRLCKRTACQERNWDWRTNPCAWFRSGRSHGSWMNGHLQVAQKPLSEGNEHLGNKCLSVSASLQVAKLYNHGRELWSLTQWDKYLLRQCERNGENNCFRCTVSSTSWNRRLAFRSVGIVKGVCMFRPQPPITRSKNQQFR